MPEVSVIMPVYNKAEYLAHGLQSILDQTFPDFELLVINDGSTDDSLAILLVLNPDLILKIKARHLGSTVYRFRVLALDQL